MLGIRTAEKNDFSKIIKFLAHEKIELPSDVLIEEKEWMILEDSDLVLGFAVGEMRNEKPFISTVFIPEKLRGHLMGDAVLRGLLYYILGRKFETVYADAVSPIADFLRHEGFSENDDTLSLNLAEFFDRKCRGCRE